MGDPTAPSPAPFDWDKLGYAKAAGKFLDGYPAGVRTFYSPRDLGVHDVICALLRTVEHSLVLNMYGYDDPHADQIIPNNSADTNVFLQTSLDSSKPVGQQHNT